MSDKQRRWQPFALPGPSSEAEESIALLAWVAEAQLRDFHQQVAAVRARAERASNVAFIVALLAFALFLAQDFQFAPIWRIAALALLALASLALGIALRTVLVDGRTFRPPEVVLARKLSWQWVAMPLGAEHGMVLWDTLTDEALTLQLHPQHPKPPDWLFRELDPITGPDEEKAIIGQLDYVLNQWQAAPDPVRLPRIADDEEALVSLLMNLPRSKRIPPAPPLPPVRPVEQGRDELQRLMELYEKQHIFLRLFNVWEENLPPFRRTLERLLRAAQPRLTIPPSPPPSHPSGDVEALIGSLEMIRGTAIESVRIPLHEEAQRLNDELNGRLRALQEDWERKRNDVTMNTNALLTTFERQITELEQRVIPDAERHLKEKQGQQREAIERVNRSEAELSEKRRQLLLLSGGSDSPRASDEKRRQFNQEIERLTNTLPEAKRAVTMWEEVIQSYRGALEREQASLKRVRDDAQSYTQQRDERLRDHDTAYEAARTTVESDYRPALAALQSDLAYFELLTPRFAGALEPFRVDLVMENEASRPYSEVFRQTQRLLEEKLAAVRRWDEQIRALIQQRRDMVRHIAQAIEEAALPGHSLTQDRTLLLPVWYVESRAGSARLFPQRAKPGPLTSHLLAPFTMEPTGRRMALASGAAHFMAPHPAFQRRLDALMAGERREAIIEAARTWGRAVPLDMALLRDIAIATQMPRTLGEVMFPGQALPPSLGVPEPALGDPDTEDDALTPALATDPDAFVLDEQPPDDAWLDASAAASAPPDESDAWEDVTLANGPAAARPLLRRALERQRRSEAEAPPPPDPAPPPADPR